MWYEQEEEARGAVPAIKADKKRRPGGCGNLGSFCRDGIFSVINSLESGPSEARRTTPRRGQFALLQEPLRDGEKGEEKGNYGIFYRRDKAPHPFKGLCWSFQSRGRAGEIKKKKNTRELKKWTAVGKGAPVPTYGSQREKGRGK